MSIITGMKVRSAFDDRLREIDIGLSRLGDGQGRISRRNARAAVKYAVNKLLSAMDAAYPTIRKELTKPRKRLPFKARLKKLKASGWTPYISSNTTGPGIRMSDIAAAGVRVRKVDGIAWVPTWVLEAGLKPNDVAGLTRLKNDIVARKATLAAKRLVAMDNIGLPAS